MKSKRVRIFINATVFAKYSSRESKTIKHLCRFKNVHEGEWTEWVVFKDHEIKDLKKEFELIETTKA